MTLLRALTSEVLKLRRTFALKLAVLAPMAMVILVAFIVAQSPYSTINAAGRDNAWVIYTNMLLRLWSLLALNLVIILESVLIGGIDQFGGNFKSLLTRPVHRWELYSAKLLVTIALILISSIVILLGLLLSGFLLPLLEKQLIFRRDLPLALILRRWGAVFVLSIPTIAIQHCVTMKSRSFAVASALGFVGFIAGVVINLTPVDALPVWCQYAPWAVPMLPFAKHPTIHLGEIFGLEIIGGLMISAYGIWEFGRKQVL